MPKPPKVGTVLGVAANESNAEPQVDLDAELAYLTFRANQEPNDALLFLTDY